MKLSALTFATVMFSTLMWNTASASDSDVNASQEQATLIVYRTDGSFRTSRIRFSLDLDGMNVGRLKSDGSLVSRQPAGVYELGATLPGAEPITVELKPGAVHYINSDLTLTGGHLELQLSEVAEQLALSQNEQLADQAI